MNIYFSLVTYEQAKIQALLEKYSVVSQLNSERYLQLERAQSLASQFWETYEELWPWLQETRASFSQLPKPAIEYEALRQQQEELRVRDLNPSQLAELLFYWKHKGPGIFPDHIIVEVVIIVSLLFV